MTYGQKLSWSVRESLGESAVISVIFETVVVQSENYTKTLTFRVEECCCGWQWQMKMIGKLFELKEGLTWVKGMEVKYLLVMIVISMMMIIDDDCDDCGENTSCNVSIMDSGNLMFLFSISWIGNSPLTITTTFGWRWEMDRRYPNLFHLSCWCRYYSYRSV